jgi:hypothetical protein
MNVPMLSAPPPLAPFAATPVGKDAELGYYGHGMLFLVPVGRPYWLFLAQRSVSSEHCHTLRLQQFPWAWLATYPAIVYVGRHGAMLSVLAAMVQPAQHVALCSHGTHEVTPMTCGERYTMVTGLFILGVPDARDNILIAAKRRFLCTAVLAAAVAIWFWTSSRYPARS